MFDLYRQRLIERQENMNEISIWERKLNNIQYADDTVLLADSKNKLEALVNNCQRKGLKIIVVRPRPQELQK